MKIFEKIKRGLIGIEAILLIIPTKVFATYYDHVEQILYGVAEPPPESKFHLIIAPIWNIVRMFVIPLVLLIGIIRYLKKSDHSIVRKIITIILALAIVAILYFIINTLVIFS